MSQDQIQEIEVTIEELQHAVELSAALDRLRKNADFKLLINEEFLREESVRLVSLKASPSQQEPAQQAAIVKQIDGVGSLRMFFHKIYVFGDQAEKEIAVHRETIEEIRSSDEEVDTDA